MGLACVRHEDRSVGGDRDAEGLGQLAVIARRDDNTRDPPGDGVGGDHRMRGPPQPPCAPRTGTGDNRSENDADGTTHANIVA